MAVSVKQEFEATREQYDQVNEALDVKGNPPAGLILHTGAVLEGGRFRVFDVWESAEAFGAFAEQRLGPAVAQVMGEGTGDPPDIEILELIDTIKP